MVRLLPIIAAAAISIPECHGFVTPAVSSVRASEVRQLDAKLEGREIDGVLAPTNNFVLIKRAEILDETEGGILLTGTVSDVIIYYCHRRSDKQLFKVTLRV